MCPKIRNNICNFVIVFVSECIFNFFKRGFIRDKIIQDRKTNRILIESKGEPTDIELLSPNELRLVGGRERRWNKVCNLHTGPVLLSKPIAE